MTLKTILPSLFFLLIASQNFAQTDSLAHTGIAHVAILAVNTFSHDFEGGNVNAYPCPGCSPDSLPFYVEYINLHDRNWGRELYNLKIKSNDSLVLQEDLIFRGGASLSYPPPQNFHWERPFKTIDTLNPGVPLPEDVHTYRYYEDKDPYEAYLQFQQTADSAWQTINKQEIVRLYAEKNAIIVIYPHLPGSPVEHYNPFKNVWLFILYYYDETLNEVLVSQDNLGPFIAPVRLFPNPTKGIVRFDQFHTQFKTYRVYNNFGQIAQQGQIVDLSIDLSGLESGNYFLQLFDLKGKIIGTQKVIKK